MRHLPNLISLTRAILAFIMFFMFNQVWLFLSLYLVCGLSDVVDGYLARTSNTQSELGAKLDSIADTILFAVITTAVILWMESKALVFVPWIILIVLIRCGNLAIAVYKYHAFVMLHTWGNKITGLLLFLAPPLYLIVHSPIVFWPPCIAAIVSAAEETAIHITTSKENLDINRQSIIKS